MPTINKTIEKINNFAHLPIGWHYGDGNLPTEQIIEDAENFVRKAETWGISEANAFPGIDGQIEVTFYVKEYTYAFMFEVEGTVSIVKEKLGEVIWDVYEQPYIVAEDKLWEISQEILITSDSFISDTGTQKTRDSEQHFSNAHQGGKTRLEVSRLFQLNASKKAGDQFVNISDIFTAQSSLTLPSSCH